MLIRFSSGDLPEPVKKHCCGSKNGIAMTSCKSCDGSPQKTGSTWEDFSHVPVVEEFKDWKIHTNIMEGTGVSRAAKTIVGQGVPFLQAQHKVVLAERNYMLGFVGEKDEMTTVKLLETDLDDKEEILCLYLLGGFL